ncbi:uncharacterized protein LOC108039740 isoform X3 [Drosophila rhopaloa]|uniref:Galectin n=1 Tax=Drosophila rhopaloa TaxID=1041015 RepID=A0ABM5J3F8_DRORH|nr:uncharacterized protein LOC108039740 isoform X3 [Drosophila rhopaloa]
MLVKRIFNASLKAAYRLHTKMYSDILVYNAIQALYKSRKVKSFESVAIFSVNFVNSTNCTDNITYHFKVVIPTQTIIENYKRNGEWSSLHQEKYLNIFDETSFCLEFAFDYENSTMRVYQGRDAGHNFITEYETLFSLSDILAIQVWGDVQKVNQFALAYN